jgi:cytochrome c peroxidase
MFHKLGCQRFLGLGVALSAVLATGTIACDSGGDEDGFSGLEWERIRSMSTNAKDHGGVNPMPSNPTNPRADDPAIVTLGQMLFFETEYAEPLTADNANGKKGETGKVGCLTCHDPNHYFTRGEAATAGLGGLGRRNAPNMLNVGYLEWFGWTGRHDSLISHGTGVMGTAATRLAVMHYIYKKYKNEWNAAFGQDGPQHLLDPALDPMDPEFARFPPTGNPKANEMAMDGPWEKMTAADQKKMDQWAWDVGRIWESYPRAMVTHGSAFQNYIDGDKTALSPGAKRGLKLFLGKGACSDCHNGPGLSDSKPHNIAVPSPPVAPGAMPPAPDNGRFADLNATLTSKFNGVSEFSEDKAFGERKLQIARDLADEVAKNDMMKQQMTGAFKTMSLHNVEKTGPYFHTGLVNTLEEVVQHYNKGGGDAGSFTGMKDPKMRALLLSDEEVSDIVEFLKALTGALDPQLIINKAKPPL